MRKASDNYGAFVITHSSFEHRQFCQKRIKNLALFKSTKQPAGLSVVAFEIVFQGRLVDDKERAAESSLARLTDLVQKYYHAY
jgi:hypothetical protein